jgi:hypothetical protein
MHKAEILHERSVVMHQKPRRVITGIEMLMPPKTGIHRTSSSLQSKRRSSMRLYPFRRERHSPLRTCADAPERLPGPERIFCPADVDVEDAHGNRICTAPCPHNIPGAKIIRGIQPNTADFFRAFHSLQGPANNPAPHRNYPLSAGFKSFHSFLIPAQAPPNG